MTPFDFTVRVEFEDIDCYGILHHPKLFYYCERARAAFLLAHGVSVAASPYGLVLREAKAKFRTPMRIFDEITVRVTVRDIGRMNFHWQYRLMKDESVMAECAIDMCAIDLATKKLIPLPDDLRAILATIAE